mgnify:CR=1 FL=1
MVKLSRFIFKKYVPEDNLEMSTVSSLYIIFKAFPVTSQSVSLSMLSPFGMFKWTVLIAGLG